MPLEEGPRLGRDGTGRELPLQPHSKGGAWPPPEGRGLEVGLRSSQAKAPLALLALCSEQHRQQRGLRSWRGQAARFRMGGGVGQWGGVELCH